jgi:hypothetical protein
MLHAFGRGVSIEPLLSASLLTACKTVASAALSLSRINPAFAAAETKSLVLDSVEATMQSLRERSGQPRFRPCGPSEVFA